MGRNALVYIPSSSPHRRTVGKGAEGWRGDVRERERVCGGDRVKKEVE